MFLAITMQLRENKKIERSHPPLLFYQIKCEIIFHDFFLSLCTPLVDIATLMCSVTLIGFSSVHVMPGIWSLVYSIFKKGHSATTKRVLILWSELIHLSTRLNTPIDKYGMTLRLKCLKNLFFLRYNWIFHKLI